MQRDSCQQYPARYLISVLPTQIQTVMEVDSYGSLMPLLYAGRPSRCVPKRGKIGLVLCSSPGPRCREVPPTRATLVAAEDPYSTSLPTLAFTLISPGTTSSDPHARTTVVIIRHSIK